MHHAVQALAGARTEHAFCRGGSLHGSAPLHCAPSFVPGSQRTALPLATHQSARHGHTATRSPTLNSPSRLHSQLSTFLASELERDGPPRLHLDDSRASGRSGPLLALRGTQGSQFNLRRRLVPPPHLLNLGQGIRSLSSAICRIAPSPPLAPGRRGASSLSHSRAIWLVRRMGRGTRVRTSLLSSGEHLLPRLASKATGEYHGSSKHGIRRC